MRAALWGRQLATSSQAGLRLVPVLPGLERALGAPLAGALPALGPQQRLCSGGGILGFLVNKLLGFATLSNHPVLGVNGGQVQAWLLGFELGKAVAFTVSGRGLLFL